MHVGISRLPPMPACEILCVWCIRQASPETFVTEAAFLTLSGFDHLNLPYFFEKLPSGMVQQFCFAQHVSGHHRHVLQFIDGLHLPLIQPTHSILVRMGFEALHDLSLPIRSLRLGLPLQLWNRRSARPEIMQTLRPNAFHPKN